MQKRSSYSEKCNKCTAYIQYMNTIIFVEYFAKKKYNYNSQ